MNRHFKPFKRKPLVLAPASSPRVAIRPGILVKPSKRKRGGWLVLSAKRKLERVSVKWFPSRKKADDFASSCLDK